MKKLISALLLAGLCASVLPLSVSAAENDNLAIGATVVTKTAHEDEGWNWSAANLNDGDRIEASSQNTGGGYRNAVDGDATNDQFVGVVFTEAKTFNTVIVTPTAYESSYDTFPKNFEVQVTTDGETWNTVKTYTDFALDMATTPTYCPQTLTFDAQTAKGVRLLATEMVADHENRQCIKFTEFEVYNVTSTVEAPVSLAVGKPVTSNSSHEDGPWALTNINDGDIIELNTSTFDFGQFAGYHTSASNPVSDPQFTIELGEGTKFDKVVIYPATMENKYGATDAEICFPANFKIQISDDGETFTDVVTKEGYSCTTSDPQVFTFDEVTAKYVRFQVTDLSGYVKLTEFEVYSTAVEEEPSTTPTTPGSSPATGDTVLTVSAIALVATAALVIVTRRRKVTE